MDFARLTIHQPLRSSGMPAACRNFPTCRLAAAACWSPPHGGDSAEVFRPAPPAPFTMFLVLDHEPYALKLTERSTSPSSDLFVRCCLLLSFVCVSSRELNLCLKYNEQTIRQMVYVSFTRVLKTGPSDSEARAAQARKADGQTNT